MELSVDNENINQISFSYCSLYTRLNSSPNQLCSFMCAILHVSLENTVNAHQPCEVFMI